MLTSELRSYATSLRPVWPSVDSWATGKWNQAAINDCYKFLLAGIENRSVKMVSLVAVALIDWPVLRRAIFDQLEPNQIKKLQWLSQMGTCSALSDWRKELN